MTTTHRRLLEWAAWFSGTLAIVAGILMSLGVVGEALTSATSADLAEVGGMSGGSEVLIVNYLACSYGFCTTSGSQSYMCLDPGQKPSNYYNGKIYTLQTIVSCAPEYWWNNYNCSGTPTITSSTCGYSRINYVDP